MAFDTLVDKAQLEAKFTAIADAIRSKLSITEAISVDEMPSMIMAIVTENGSVTVPSYWLKHLLSKEGDINAAINAASSDKSAFLWYTDAHWTTNYSTSPALLKHLSENTSMEKTFFGGDVATAKSGEIDALTAWHNQVKDIPNHHSVLGNHDNQVTELSTNTDKSNFFFGAEDTSKKVFGTSSSDGMLYYYIDNAEEKTRYICLSTGRMWTSSDEVVWCINTLNSTPEGWHIVMISHLWLNMDYSGESAVLITTPVDYSQVYLDLCDAYNHREKGSATLHSAAYDFRKGKAKVEFIIGGHIHQDYDFTSTRGIPVILTECDSWQERDDVSVATAGTTTESCVYAVIADYTAKTVNVINVGRGDPHSVNIPDVVIEDIPDDTSYTNWAKKSYADSTMTTIYNDKGYKENTRMSSGTEVAETGWTVTGFIPFKRGDTIRFKNCNFYNMSGHTHSRTHFCYYDESFTYLGMSAFPTVSSPFSSDWNPVHDERGDLLQATAPSGVKSTARYIRITMDDINEDSIITVNELIDDDSGSDSGETTNPDVPSGNYTNVLTAAGYKTNTRLSVSGGGFDERTESGWCTSGCFAAVAGDTIRLKNCTFTKSTTASTHRGGIYGANPDGTYSGQMVSMSQITDGVVYDESGDNVIQFNVPKSIKSPGCVRIVVQSFTADSIVTVNEEIV